MWQRLLVAGYTHAPRRLRRQVVRMVTPGYRAGVLAVLRRPDGRVLLVDQPYVDGWSLPGGDLKRGESVRDAIVRELREELGVALEVPTPVLAAQRVHDRWVTFVTTLDVSEDVAEELRPRSAELSRSAWFAPDALPPLDGDAVEPLRLVGLPA